MKKLIVNPIKYFYVLIEYFYYLNAYFKIHVDKYLKYINCVLYNIYYFKLVVLNVQFYIIF